MSVRRRRLPLEELAPYLIATPNPPTPLDWRAVFGNDHPVEIEVGFGKGLFLVTTAPQHPEVNFLGIEIVRKYQLFTATRLAKRGLGNVRLACADARLFLRDCVTADSVRAMYVYFPDPWWKTRHHKRRLFTEEFVVQCERVLRTGGRLNIATDVADYFAVMQTLLAEKTTLVPLPPPETNDTDDLTNFERKARLAGTPVWRAMYEKLSDL